MRCLLLTSFFIISKYIVHIIWLVNSLQGPCYTNKYILRNVLVLKKKTIFYYLEYPLLKVLKKIISSSSTIVKIENMQLKRNWSRLWSFKLFLGLKVKDFLLNHWWRNQKFDFSLPQGTCNDESNLHFLQTLQGNENHKVIVVNIAL